jgi:hypothetical protein
MALRTNETWKLFTIRIKKFELNHGCNFVRIFRFKKYYCMNSISNAGKTWKRKRKVNHKPLTWKKDQELIKNKCFEKRLIKARKVQQTNSSNNLVHSPTCELVETFIFLLFFFAFRAPKTFFSITPNGFRHEGDKKRDYTSSWSFFSYTFLWLLFWMFQQKCKIPKRFFFFPFQRTNGRLGKVKRAIKEFSIYFYFM